ncbi:hypothetical protein CAL7716_102780 (plasmid) [Calothrix sp. PCC 7716]|nr:hypothetical protein CAL7716_102780 [Calothrix sp. PCC 7716]
MPKTDKENSNFFAPLSSTIKPQVLLVDDNPDNLILLQFMLEEVGYQTSTANCGQQALQLVKASPPNLILLDLMMPDMNGLEVASWLRWEASTQDIPIVLVTAYTDDLKDVDCRLVDGVLAKPIDEVQLFSLVDFLINTKDT